MVRNYIKKTNRKVASPSKLKKAANLVSNGYAIRAAARHTNINRQVLWSFLKKRKNQESDREGKNDFKLSQVSRQIFTNDQEDSIVQYCLDLCHYGYGLTSSQVRVVAFEVARKNGIDMPPNWQRNKEAGIDWFQGFTKRHGNKLSIRKPEACSSARAMAFNKPNVDNFHDKLEEVLSRHPSFQDGSRVYNLDETSTSTVHNDRKLVSPKGTKQVYQIKTAERGTSVTTTIIIGANGTILPPVMSFPRKKFQPHMLINAYKGTLGLANESGYNTKETFYKVLEHFIKYTKSSKENPTLLMLDNVGTHFSVECLDLAKENGVTIFTFPPHCTHKLQPLDVGFFAPFNAAYYNAIHTFIRNNVGVPVTIYHIAGFVRDAMSLVATPATIFKSFGKPGISPFNRHAFTETDFMMAQVTDQPAPEGTLSVIDEETERGETSERAVENEVDDFLQDDSLNNEDTPTSNEKSDGFVSPEALFGYPKAKPREKVRKPRKKGRCMVATDTPEKSEITGREIELALKKKRSMHARGIEKKTLRKRKNLKQTNRVLTFENYENLGDSEEEEDAGSFERNRSVKKRPNNLTRLQAFQNEKLDPSEGDYVLVCLKTKKTEKYFVGKIISEIDDDGDYQIYLRKTDSCDNRFMLPHVPDLHSVHSSDIKAVLPAPSCPSSLTQRQKSILEFDYNFDGLKVE